MKILLSGSTGLIGSELTSHLSKKGLEVGRLVRAKSSASGPQVLWNPVARIIDSKGLEGFDAVVHLAGDPIAEGRWTPEKKALIRDSRVRGTRFLAESLARLSKPPRTFLCASAVGFYGERGDETLTEESGPGKGFLPEVGQEWEGACQPAVQTGARVVNLRFGIVIEVAHLRMSRQRGGFPEQRSVRAIGHVPKEHLEFAVAIKIGCGGRRTVSGVGILVLGSLDRKKLFARSVVSFVANQDFRASVAL